MLADSAGAALVAGAHAPAGFREFVRWRGRGWRSSPASSRRRGEPHLVGDAEQAAGLDQPGRPQGVERDQQARREAEAVGGRIRLLVEQRRATAKVALPTLILVADLQAEPLEQDVGRGRAEDAAALGEQFGDRAAPASSPARRRADRRRRRPSTRPAPGRSRPAAAPSSASTRSAATAPRPSKKRLLRSARLALHELEAQIAAEQRLALIGDARR